MADPCIIKYTSTCSWRNLLSSTSVTTMESNFQLLVEKGVDLHIRDDQCGFTHLFNVAQMGQGHGFCKRYTNYPLLDFLLERPEFSREDKIDALEMAGACILLANDSQENFPLAYQYWRRALSLRLMDTEEYRPIYKTPTNSKNGQFSEWSTLDDINRLEQNPSHQCAMIQSLLVQLRIYSSISWKALNGHFSFYLQDLLWKGQDHPCLLSPLLDLVLTQSDTLLRSWCPREKNAEMILTHSVIRFMDSPILIFERLPQGDPQLNSENLSKLVELLLMSDPSYLYDPNFMLQMNSFSFELDAKSHWEKWRKMFTILSQHRELITEEIRLSLIQQFPSGLNMLHIACRKPDQETPADLRFLVSLGASLNVSNKSGNRVLHMLAVQRQSNIRDSTARLLKKLGAHLCPGMVNKEGRTAAQLWAERNRKQDMKDLPDWLRYDEDDVVCKLKCQAAQVVRRHKVPHDEMDVPATLLPFVSWH